MIDDPEEMVESDGELIILEVERKTARKRWFPIESDEMFDNIAAIFEERLADLFEIEEMETPKADEDT